MLEKILLLAMTLCGYTLAQDDDNLLQTILKNSTVASNFTGELNQIVENESGMTGLDIFMVDENGDLQLRNSTDMWDTNGWTFVESVFNSTENSNYLNSSSWWTNITTNASYVSFVNHALMDNSTFGDYEYAQEYDWQEEKFQKWNESAENGDFVGVVLNNPCTEKCKFQNCEHGLSCEIATCTKPCQEITECTQTIMFEDWSWETFDCTNGTFFGDNDTACVDYCEYEDCQDKSENEVCWQETCDNGCGQSNCTLWHQDENEEWFSKDCSIAADWNPELPPYDWKTTWSRVTEGLKDFEESIASIAGNACTDKETCDAFVETSEQMANDEDFQFDSNTTEFVSMLGNTGLNTFASTVQAEIPTAIPYIGTAISTVDTAIFENEPIKSTLNIVATETLDVIYEDENGEVPDMSDDWINPYDFLEAASTSDLILGIPIGSTIPEVVDWVEPTQEADPDFADWWGIFRVAVGRANGNYGSRGAPAEGA